MRSNPDGGYIVVGADDQGRVVSDLAPEMAKLLDEARLRPKLRKYFDPSFLEVRSCEHTVGGHLVVLIYVASSRHGFVVFNADGQYKTTAGKDQVSFVQVTC